MIQTNTYSFYNNAEIIATCQEGHLYKDYIKIDLNYFTEICVCFFNFLKISKAGKST